MLGDLSVLGLINNFTAVPAQLIDYKATMLGNVCVAPRIQFKITNVA